MLNANYRLTAVKFCQFLVLASIFMTSFSWAAGTRDGGGGNGIIINNKPYLLDLFEYGVHLKPLFSDSIPVNLSIAKRVAAALPEMSYDVHVLVALKLTEIFKYNRVTALSLLAGMEMYTWRLIDAKLTDLDDDDGSDVDIDRGVLVQLAIRSSHTIRISNQFRALDPANAAALVFHEVIYAMLPPQRIKVSEHHENVFQQSRRAREITGYLFSTYFASKGVEGFDELIAWDLPQQDEQSAVKHQESASLVPLLLGRHVIYLLTSLDTGHDSGVAISYGDSEIKNYTLSDIASYICHLPPAKINTGSDFSINTIYVHSYEPVFDNYDKSQFVKQTYLKIENKNSEQYVQYINNLNGRLKVSLSDYGKPDCVKNLNLKLENAFRSIGFDPGLQ